ncbi:MAG: glycosyltransferase [Patescibacteria group bacterium]|nr:glycosyltransferase [Patescibacteria group bacterium]
MARIIALVGGGTMGPVVPLLALQKKLAQRHPEDKFVWVGTPDGPERAPVEALGIPFVALPVAKLPRYLTWRLFMVYWEYRRARKAAIKFLDDWKPDMIIGAGGFTQVPIIRAASRRGIPCAIHQLDFVPLLSNRLVAKYCRLITTTFIYHQKKLTVPIFKYSLKMPVEEMPIATPNRYVGKRIPEKIAAMEHFGFDSDRPLVLFVGGGTGSRALNTVVETHLDKWLSKTQVLQITGKGRSLGAQERPGYVKQEFFNEDDFLRALMAADVIVSRAGMGSITDLATLYRPSILVPINHSPQEQNARRLPLAVIEVRETPRLFEDLFHQVSHLLNHPQEKLKFGYELHRTIRTDDGSEWANLIERFLPQEE